MKLLEVKFVFIIHSFILIFKFVTAGYKKKYCSDNIFGIVGCVFKGRNCFTKPGKNDDVSNENSDGFNDDSVSDECGRNSDSCPLKSKDKVQGNCNKCGIAFGGSERGRVINGKPVKPVYKYPWIVPLIKNNKLLCGGALISANFVLTAAHCVFDIAKILHPRCSGKRVHKSCYLSPKSVFVGLLGTKQRTPSESLAVSKIIAHPKFSFSKQVHDVALLQLAKPVRCSAYTMPVCLPPKDFHRIGAKLIISGYGRNTPEGTVGLDVLREGVVKEIDPKNCFQADKQPEDIVSNILCIAGKESGQSSCFGDSGSTVLRKYKSKFYTVGIVSHGKSPECSEENPVTLMKTHSYLRFIKQHVKNLPKG